jgi:hypothetical protein
MFATDITGNRERSNADARIVNIIPLITNPSDAAMDVMGPLNEKSNSTDRSFGNDRRGVIQPKKGKVVGCKDGIGTGGPIFSFFRLATK